MDLLPCEILTLINEQRAATIIQSRAYKLFYKVYGPTWKYDIKYHSHIVYMLDYYSNKNGINDPWYDYCDDIKYDYCNDIKYDYFRT
jgi:hypothetical protein